MDYLDTIAATLGIDLRAVLLPTAKPVRKRRERKPTLAGALKQAGKAGAKVRGATVAADGSVSLQFGEAKTEQTNEPDPWERAMQGPKQ